MLLKHSHSPVVVIHVVVLMVPAIPAQVPRNLPSRLRVVEEQS